MCGCATQRLIQQMSTRWPCGGSALLDPALLMVFQLLKFAVYVQRRHAELRLSRYVTVPARMWPRRRSHYDVVQNIGKFVLKSRHVPTVSLRFSSRNMLTLRVAWSGPCPCFCASSRTSMSTWRRSLLFAWSRI